MQDADIVAFDAMHLQCWLHALESYLARGDLGSIVHQPLHHSAAHIRLHSHRQLSRRMDSVLGNEQS